MRTLLLVAGGLLGIGGLAAYVGGDAASRADPAPAPSALPRETAAQAAPTAGPPVPPKPDSLALLVPEGYRAISLQTTDEIAVSGLLRPGDMVDVQMVLRGETLAAPRGIGDRSEARTLLENVPVLAVGDSMTPAESNARNQGARTVTLALQPPQVSRFTLARSLGSLYLTLRNPADTALASANRAVLHDIRGGGAPRTATTRRRHGRARAIQLVIGSESRTVLAPLAARGAAR